MLATAMLRFTFVKQEPKQCVWWPVLFMHMGMLRTISSNITPGTPEDDRYYKFFLAHRCSRPSSVSCCNDYYQQEDFGLLSIKRGNIKVRETTLGMFSFDCVQFPSETSGRITRRSHILVCPAGSNAQASRYTISREDRIEKQMTDDEWIVEVLCRGPSMTLQGARPRNEFALDLGLVRFWHAVPVGEYPRDPVIYITPPDDYTLDRPLFNIDHIDRLYPDAVQWIVQNFGVEPINPREERPPPDLAPFLESRRWQRYVNQINTHYQPAFEYSEETGSLRIFLSTPDARRIRGTSRP